MNHKKQENKKYYDRLPVKQWQKQNMQKNIAVEWNKIEFKKQNSKHRTKINSLRWIFVLSGNV